MLESFFSQLVAVPSVPSLKNQREPLQATNGGAVPPVPSVPPQKTETETKNDNLQPITNNTPKMEKLERRSIEIEEVREPREHIVVICYTPNGKPIEVEARDQDHAAFILKMNPKPKGKHHE